MKFLGAQWSGLLVLGFSIETESTEDADIRDMDIDTNIKRFIIKH